MTMIPNNGHNKDEMPNTVKRTEVGDHVAVEKRLLNNSNNKSFDAYPILKNTNAG